jgi:flagellin
MSISQGAGTGYFFGTDEQNNGTLSVEGNLQNNLSVAWNDDGSSLVFNHAAAGEMTISNYDSVSTGIATFDVADTASTSVAEPVSLQEDTAFDSTASAKGIIGESKIALNFSNVFGYATDSGSGAADTDLVAEYVFKVTDGAGNIYMDFSGSSSALDVQRLNNSDAAIKTFVENNLSANIATFGDGRIGKDEFEIDYSNGVLTITNTEGRDIAIEAFSSAYGKVTVSKLDEIGGTEQLASQQALASEIRVTRGYGTSITAGTANLVFQIDGGTAVSADVSGAFLGTTATDTGWEQAALIEDALLASSATGGAYIRVAYDSETDQFVFNDTLGRSIELVSTEVANTGEYFVEEAVYGSANKANAVQTSSDTTSGVLTEATKVTLTANQDNMDSLVIGLNGATSTAATFNFANDTFAGSSLKTNLDTMVESLNANYNGAAISYEFDQANRAITFTHAKGGELFFDGHTTSSTNLEFAISVESGTLASASDTSGSGDAVIKAYEAVTTVTAEGDGEVETTSTTSSYSSSSSSSSTGIDQISISTADGANSAISSIDAALTTILSERAKLGALENRLDHTVNNLSNVSTNTSAALSRILDADFAKETTTLTKSQILSQAATSMLAQANQSKQSILALLQ